MARRILLILSILLIGSPALAGNNDGLMSYEQFLEIRGLHDSNIVERNCANEDVLIPRIHDWDLEKRVCELWVKEKVVPGQPLKYNDGTQVYRTNREWNEEVMKPTTQPRSGLFMVKQDEKMDPQPAKVSDFKRYVTTGN